MNSQSPNLQAITLDELTALNEEIAALVRAGVPLQGGLAELGREMPGRLGRFAAAVADRTGRGESLDAVMSEYSAGLPPVYLAVIEIGLRTGRLPAALETLAGSVRRVTQTRRYVVSAFLYPLLVFALAWGLLAFFTAEIAPNMLVGFDRLEVVGRDLFAWLAARGETAGWWGPAVPLGLVVLAAGWWYFATRATIAEPRFAAKLFGWLPWLGSMLHWSRAATFVDVLALLIESRVPLHEAIVLAASASGDGQMNRAAKEMGARLERGEPMGAATAGRADFPPLLRWLMAAGNRQGALLPALKHAAETYHRRARHQAELARALLPLLAVVGIGGSVVLLYGLMLFVPYVSILKAFT